jgi:hypothetical protein
MVTRKIKLPLNGTFKRYLTSGDYQELTNDLLSHLDLMYTYFFRYPRLFAVDIGGSTISQGFTIDATDVHPAVAFTTTLLFIMAAISGVSSEYQAKQKAKKAKEEQADYKNSYCHIHHSLVENPSKSLSEEKEIDEAISKANREMLNQQINDILLHDNDLRSKYQKITITEEGNVEFTLIDEAKKEKGIFSKISKKATTLMSSSWIALGLCSFAYWILWIGCGIFTGNFGVGVSAIGSAAFIVPLAVGAIYPAIRIRNWWRNHYGNTTQTENETVLVTENSKKTMKAALVLAKVMRKAAFINERKRLERELTEAKINIPEKVKVSGILKHDSNVAILAKGSKKKVVTEFIAVTVSSFIGAEYAAWITTDLLKVAANVTLNSAGFAMGFGIAFMVCSVAYGAYKAFKKHKEVARYREEAVEIKAALDAKVTFLDDVYQAKLDAVQKLAREIKQLDKSGQWLNTQMEKFNNTMALAPKAPEPTQSKLKSYLYSFITGITTGAMIARIATIAGTAVFLPFAAAALANPYTIAVVVSVACIYGLFKVYQHWQKQIDDKIKLNHEQRAEKISSLQDQVDLADLQIKLLEDKKAKLQQEVFSSLPKANSRAAIAGRFFDDTVVVSRSSSPVSSPRRSYSSDDSVIGSRSPSPTLFKDGPELLGDVSLPHSIIVSC